VTSAARPMNRARARRVTQTCRGSVRPFVDMFVGVDPIHRKARTREELEAVMNEPRNVSPTREVWIHESLVDEARQLWKEMVADLTLLKQSTESTNGEPTSDPPLSNRLGPKHCADYSSRGRERQPNRDGELLRD